MEFMTRSTLEIWRLHFCEGEWGRCERWKLVSAGHPVPVNLLPNGRMLDVPLEQLDARYIA